MIGSDALAAFTAVLGTVPDRGGVVVHRRRAALPTDAIRLPARPSSHHVFTVQGNQPMLRAALARLLWAQVPGLLERHAGHGQVGSA